MTEQEINCAIAEARGWQDIYAVSNKLCGLPPHGYFKAGEMMYHPNIPDYCSDHNDIHEARNSLTPDQQEIYAKTLLGYDIANVDGTTDWTAAFDLHNKTPRECAEAFLRTVGKWKD
jgi:hypothetical protein